MTHAQNFRDRGTGRRTGRDRRAAAERRAAERRERQKAAAIDRRAGLDRRAAARRGDASRRRARDRRHERFGFGPVGILGSMEPASNARPHTSHQSGEITARDRSRARRLPEEFLASSGSAMDRLSKVIRHAWPRHPLPVRAAMAETLLPVLTPLLGGDGMAVTPQVRNDCEEAAVQGLLIRAH